jgi:hypothetical protein
MTLRWQQGEAPSPTTIPRKLEDEGEEYDLVRRRRRIIESNQSKNRIESNRINQSVALSTAWLYLPPLPEDQPLPLPVPLRVQEAK